MNWWSWMIGGAILLGAELGFVNAQFYLVFIGAAALVVGLASAAFPGPAPDAQWALFAILAVLSMVMSYAAGCTRAAARPGPPAMKGGPAGGVLTLPEALDRGSTARSSTAARSGRCGNTARNHWWPAMSSARRPVCKA